MKQMAKQSLVAGVQGGIVQMPKFGPGSQRAGLPDWMPKLGKKSGPLGGLWHFDPVIMN
tara:strand:- start:37 stop:213 length:177 start_codon:yes stop_codon:yes gene_type:complete